VLSKLLRFISVSLVMALVLSGAGARAADKDTVVSTPAPTAGTATIHGHISDPSGAMIPGAKVVIVNSAGSTVSTATADETGAYTVSNVPVGSYYVQANYDGFAPFQSPLITLTDGQSKHIKIVMAIEVAQQNVIVTDDAASVSTEAGANTDSVVLRGKDLDALSDDPDELSEELSALAGPSAGPNGGQIYIDGFSGGQLPPKSAILLRRVRPSGLWTN